MIHDTQSAQISQKQDEYNIYVIMKTMCPPGFYRNGFVATHALRHMMYGYRGSLMTTEAKINPICLNPFKFKISPHPLMLQWWNWFRKTEVSPHKKKKKEKKKLQKNQPTNQNKTGQVISCLMFSWGHQQVRPTTLALLPSKLIDVTWSNQTGVNTGMVVAKDNSKNLWH